MVYSTRRFVVCLSMCHFVLVFFIPFSIAITSLGEERANLSALRTFVRFVLVWICRFPLPLGVWEGLRFVIVALPGLFSYRFLLEVLEDLDMNENRIRDLRNPRDANDAVNKKYMNKRIEYKTKDLENKLTAIQTQITNIQQQLDGTKPFTSDLDMGNNRIINVGHPRNPEHNIEHENDAVTAKFLYDYAKIAGKKFMKTNEDIDMKNTE